MVRHQLHALIRRHFSGFRQSAIAALLDRQINQNCAGLHAFQHFFCDQFGGRAARNKRRANDNILLGNMFGDQSLLALLIISAHFFGITAFGFAAISIIGFHHDKCAAQTLHLLGSGSPHIGGADNCAQTLGCRNSLQTGNACAHNKDARGRHRARRRHHHWQSAAIFGSCIKDRLITGEI